MHQKVIAVKKEDIAYTSPSTAENQNESENVYARAPIIPLPITAYVLPISKDSFKKILRPNAVIVQNKNSIVSEEHIICR